MIFFRPARVSVPMCLARMVVPWTNPKCSTMVLPGTESILVRIIAESCISSIITKGIIRLTPLTFRSQNLVGDRQKTIGAVFVNTEMPN